MIAIGECSCGRVGILRDDRCTTCHIDAAIDGNTSHRASPVQVSAMPATVAELLGRYVAELEAEEVIDPLAQRFTLAGVWADLARLAGEELPAEVAGLVGDTLATVCDPLPMRGSYADYTREALPAD
jgi:hypothetical protein